MFYCFHKLNSNSCLFLCNCDTKANFRWMWLWKRRTKSIHINRYKCIHIIYTTKDKQQLICLNASPHKLSHINFLLSSANLPMSDNIPTNLSTKLQRKLHSNIVNINIMMSPVMYPLWGSLTKYQTLLQIIILRSWFTQLGCQNASQTNNTKQCS